MTDEIIIRLKDQREFEKFWQITEDYLNPLCNFNTAILLDQCEQGFDLKFTLLKKDEVQAIYLGLAALLATITAKFLLEFHMDEVIGEKLKKKESLLKNGFQHTLDFESATVESVTELQQLLKLENPAYQQVLTKLIYEALLVKNLLHLQGFYDFRLKELNNLANKAIGNVIGKALEQADYLILITALKQFIAKQKPVISIVHILLHENGSFELYDHKGIRIRKQEIIAELDIAKGLNCGYEESLASAMITLAPQQIIFHKKNPQTPISLMMKDLLEEKIQLCKGCALCQSEVKPAVPVR